MTKIFISDLLSQENQAKVPESLTMECGRLGTVTVVKVGVVLCPIITENENKQLLVWSIQTLRGIDTRQKMPTLLYR